MATEMDFTVAEAPVPYPVPVATVTGGVRLFGYSVAETSGTASATVTIHDGTDATGLAAIPVTLTSNQSTEDWFGPQGLLLRNGMFVVVTGAVEGSLFITDEC